MGYLTTITFRNDSYSDFDKNPERTIEVIKAAMDGAYRSSDKSSQTMPIGSSCNPVVFQKPRHAGDNALYMHYGNTVKCLNEVTADDQWILDQAIDELRYRLKALEKIRKNSK